MFRKVFSALIFIICVTVQAQTVTQQPMQSVADSVEKVIAPDTMSAPVQSIADTIRQPVDTVVTPSTASLVIDTIKSPTLAVSKKKYNHREQIVFATIMMLFIAVVISSAQNWNPD
jgi:hypothetical protein